MYYTISITTTIEHIYNRANKPRPVETSGEIHSFLAESKLNKIYTTYDGLHPIDSIQLIYPKYSILSGT